MDKVPRFIPLLALLLLLASACGRAAAKAPLPTPPPATIATVAPRPTSGATSSAPVSPGSLELSGGLSGFLSVLAVSCSPSGQSVSITIKGRVENKLYDVQVLAPSSGGYQLGASQASVQLSNQTPEDASVSRWAAGAQSAGAGSVEISDDRGGSINADLQGIAGTRGSVHLRGAWSCSA